MLLVLTIVGMAAMIGAFLGNSSPYTTIAEARRSQSDSVYVAGDLDKTTIQAYPRAGETRFNLRDAEGSVVEVRYKGSPPANMSQATRIVAIGGMRGQVFMARGLLIKCPSKYNAEQGS